MTVFPKLVAQLVTLHEAWIVGSAANPAADLNLVRDWDVAVPFRHWSHAACLIPKDATPNTFGGWKCKVGPATIDIWPDDLDTIVFSRMNKWAWQPKCGMRLTTLDDDESLDALHAALIEPKLIDCGNAGFHPIDHNPQPERDDSWAV